MSRSNAGDHVLLALVIALTAIIATAIQAIQIVDSFDPSALLTAQIFTGVLTSSSSALAMVCAILVGQKMLTGSIDLVSRVESETLSASEQIDDGDGDGDGSPP